MLPLSSQPLADASELTPRDLLESLVLALALAGAVVGGVSLLMTSAVLV